MLEFMTLVRAIVGGDTAAVERLLAAPGGLATARAEQGATRQSSRDFFLTGIRHYLYAGDTGLHIAAAAYRPAIARLLVDAGADHAARNRRGAQPLHYAADGSPGSPAWNPSAQAETIRPLIEAGADPNAPDRSGVMPLHRAVRNRCSASVRALLDGGADPHLPNGSGSTPMQLAGWTTGRGGSGSPAARAEQKEIVQLLEARAATP